VPNSEILYPTKYGIYGNEYRLKKKGFPLFWHLFFCSFKIICRSHSCGKGVYIESGPHFLFCQRDIVQYPLKQFFFLYANLIFPQDFKANATSFLASFTLFLVIKMKF